MPSKNELLKKYSNKHAVNFDLVMKVFELERGRLHPGENEEKYRQQEVTELIEKWQESHPGDANE